MKFEEAYSSFDKKLHTIQFITELYKMKPKEYTECYKGTFVCPECKKAALSFNNSITPHFKSFPHSFHEKNCTLKQTEMSAKKTAAYVKDQQNNVAIQRQMDNILKSLLSSQSTNLKENSIKESSMNNTEITILRTQYTNHQRIPRKRIDLPICREDCGCYKYFYGPVNLSWEQQKNGNYRIILKQINTYQFLCRINITSKVYEHIQNEYKIPNSYNCNIVFLSQMQKVENKNYCETVLEWGQNIIVDKTSF